MKKKLHDLMLKILPFEEFRVGDRVEYKNRECEVIKKNNENTCWIYDNAPSEWEGSEYTPYVFDLHLKFISRDWQLPDLLMAWRKRTGLTQEGFWFYKNMSVAEILKDFDLTKSVLEQEESTIKEIIGVLDE